MSERSVIKISQVRQKLSRRKLLAMVLGLIVVLGVGVGAWMWKPWVAQTPKPATSVMDTEEYSEYVTSYANARINYQVKVISVDSDAKTIKVYNTTTSNEAVYSYAKTSLAQGVAYRKLSPSEIATDDILHIVYNTESKKLESVWRPSEN